MNRKLHNTVMAMIASSSLFVLGLLTASPVAPALPPAATDSVIASIDANEVPSAGASDGDVEPGAAAPRRHVRQPRRQSLAMPFYSFAPRG